MIADIRRAVAAHYGLTDADMVSHDRHRRLARPRQVAMYLARELTGKSYGDIARVFKRDHSTVIHAVKRCDDASLQDKLAIGRLGEQVRLKCARLHFVNGKLSSTFCTSSGAVDNLLLRVSTTDPMVLA
jgi:Bacterial dnaA protein helix-turn-helix